MKKAYSTPEIEKINFQYRDQVVAASGNFFGLYGVNDCENQQVASEKNNTCVQ